MLRNPHSSKIKVSLMPQIHNIIQPALSNALNNFAT